MKKELKKDFIDITQSFQTTESSDNYALSGYKSSNVEKSDGGSWIVRNAKPSKIPYLIYGLLGIGLIVGFTMIAPILFTAIGYLLGIGVGILLLGFLWVMKEPMKKWAVIQGIKAQRKLVESNPIEHLIIERNRAVSDQQEVLKNIELLNNESTQLLHESRAAKNKITEDSNKLTILKNHLEKNKEKITSLTAVEDYDLKTFSDLEKKKHAILRDIRKLINNIKRSNEQVVKFGMESKNRKEMADKFHLFSLRHSDRIEQLSLSIKELQEDLRLNKSGVRVTEIVKRLEEIGNSAEFSWSLDAAKEQINDSKAKLDANIRSLDEKILSGGNGLEHTDEYIENELDSILKDLDSGKIGGINPDKYMREDAHITVDEEFIAGKKAYNDITKD